MMQYAKKNVIIHLGGHILLIGRRVMVDLQVPLIFNLQIFSSSVFFFYLSLFSYTFSPSYSSVNSDFSCSGKSLHICPMMRPISHSLSSGFSFFTWKAKYVTCVWDLLWHRPDPKPSCCTACRASRASPAPSVVLELHELEESWCRLFAGWTCCCHTAVVGRGWPSPRPAASEPSNNPVSLVLEGKAMQSVYKDRRGVWSIMVRKSI